MDGVGGCDSDNSSLPDPEKQPASLEDNEDPAWSPSDSSVEDEDDSASNNDDDDEEEFEHEDWEEWEQSLEKASKKETAADPADAVADLAGKRTESTEAEPVASDALDEQIWEPDAASGRDQEVDKLAGEKVEVGHEDEVDRVVVDEAQENAENALQDAVKKAKKEKKIRQRRRREAEASASADEVAEAQENAENSPGSKQLQDAVKKAKKENKIRQRRRREAEASASADEVEDAGTVDGKRKNVAKRGKIGKRGNNKKKADEDEDWVHFDEANPVAIELRKMMCFPNRDMALAWGKWYCDSQLVATCYPQKGRKTVWQTCVHFGSNRSRCQGYRPKQSSIKTGCTFLIKFNTREADDSTIVTEFNLDHNHAVTEDLFKADTNRANAESKKIIKNLMKANCGAGQISQALSKEGARLTADQVRYQMRLMKSEPADEVSLQDFLKTVTDNHGVVNMKMDANKRLQILTVVTQSMKQEYTRCLPGVVQMDCTYGTNSSAYKLFCILYPSNVTGHGEVAMFAWMMDETAASFDYVLQCFKVAYAHHPAAIMVDKDFTQLRALRKVFPTCKILLCYFHVAAWMKRLIKSASENPDKKGEIMKAFQELVVAKDKEDFAKKEAVWKEAIKGVEVKPVSSEKTVSLADYYEKNWGDEALASPPSQWAHYCRKDLPLGGHNTNNMVERNFRTLKDMLRRANAGHVKLGRSVEQMVKFSDERLDNRLIQTQRKISVQFHPVAWVMELLARAAAYLGSPGVTELRKSLDMMLVKEEKMEVVEEDGVKETFANGEEKTYETSEAKCNCTRFVQDGMPCRHILLWRQEHKMDMIDQDLFINSWHVDRYRDGNVTAPFPKEMADDVPGDDDDDDEWSVEDLKGLTHVEKFARVKPLIDMIQRLLTKHSTPQLLAYVDELREIADRIRHGQRLIDRCEECERRLIDGCVCECEKDCRCRQDQQGEDSEEPAVPRAGIKYFPHCNTRGRPTKHRPRRNFRAAKDKLEDAQDKEKVAKVKSAKRKDKVVKGKQKSATAKPGAASQEEIQISDTEYALESDTCDGKQAAEDWAIRIEGKDEPLKYQVASSVLCMAAAQFGCPFTNNDVTIAEFSTLAPGLFVSDGVVNWWARFYGQQLSQLGQDSKQVLVLSTEFYTLLKSNKWPNNRDRPPQCLMDKMDPILSLMEPDVDGTMGGYRFIVATVCERSHFYVLVYINDADRPQLVVLESIGPGYATYPTATDRFIKLLGFYRKQWNMREVAVEKSVPIVPRQAVNSNDCAMFALTFIEHLLVNPANFEDLFNAKSLDTWFDSSSVGNNNKRQAMIDTIMRESRDQRMKGYPTFFTLSSTGIFISKFQEVQWKAGLIS